MEQTLNMITQKELHEYMELEKKHKEFEKKKANLKKKLNAQIPVENGLFTAYLKVSKRNNLDRTTLYKYFAKKLKSTSEKVEMLVDKYCYKEGQAVSVKVEVKE